MHRIVILIPLAIAASAAIPDAAFAEAELADAVDSEPEEPEAADSEAVPFTAEDGPTLLISVDGVMQMPWDRRSFTASGNVRVAWGDTVVTADHALGWAARRELYVEGNVRMLTPSREMHCERAFVNWASGEVVFEEFRYRSREKTERLTWYVATPLGMRLADGTILGARATISNCDYAAPHHYLRVAKLIVEPDNDIIARHITYHVRGVPMPFYWPVMMVPGNRPTFDARAGNSSGFGTFGTLDTSFGLPVGPDTTGTVSLGYFSERGTGWGLGLEYDSPAITRGEAEYYTIPHDSGADFDGQVLGTKYRYRYKWLHSMDSPEGWELDVELQKYSDAGFRKEFFESEFYRDKEVENRVYVKRAHGNWAVFVEAKRRFNEYLDQSERLPVAGMHGFSMPLGRGVLWTSGTRFGFLRRRLSEIRRRPGDTDASFNARLEKWDAFQDLPPITPDEELGEDRTTFRSDSIHELSRPFALNRLKLEPFVGTRSTFYDKSLHDDHSLWRNQLCYGGRVSTSLHRYFDTTSKTLGIDGIRHIIVPDVSYVAKTDTWGADADELIQFDETDAARQEDYIALRLQNSFQTRRRGDVVDLLELGLETDYYPHSTRDNDGESFSPLRIDARSQPVEGLWILTNADYDFSEDERGLAFLNVASSIDVKERWSAYMGHTYERGIDSFGTYSLAYRLTPKWTAVASYDRNWRTGRSLEERLELVRDLHAFNLSIILENDERSGEGSVGFTLSPKAVKLPPRPGSFVRKLAEARDDAE